MAVLPILPEEGISLVNKNMREARFHGMSRNMALAQHYYWFYQQVRNHGPWYYKQRDRSLANFGNFNYGATGLALGIPENTLLIAAGFAQSRAKTTKEKWGAWYDKPPYGDDPHDQFWIQQGIDYACQHGY